MGGAARKCDLIAAEGLEALVSGAAARLLTAVISNERDRP